MKTITLHRDWLKIKHSKDISVYEIVLSNKLNFDRPFYKYNCPNSDHESLKIDFNFYEAYITLFKMCGWEPKKKELINA